MTPSVTPPIDRICDLRPVQASHIISQQQGCAKPVSGRVKQAKEGRKGRSQ